MVFHPDPDPHRVGRRAALVSEPRWYACRTRARAEKKVDRLLARAGIEAYLPTVELDHAWADRTKRVAFALFPGYTFARFALERFTDVVRTPGLVQVIGGRQGPVPVRDDELEASFSSPRPARLRDRVRLGRDAGGRPGRGPRHRRASVSPRPS